MTGIRKAGRQEFLATDGRGCAQMDDDSLRRAAKVKLWMIGMRKTGNVARV